MSTMLENITDVFEAVIGMVSTVGTTITGNTLLTLFCVAIPLVGIGVAMFRRLLRSRG